MSGRVEVRAFKDGASKVISVGWPAPTVVHFVEDDWADVSELTRPISLEEAMRARPMRGWREVYKRRGRGADGVYEYDLAERIREDG